ncbi:MAG: hypothetical protein PUF61_07250 [Spirochaetales bacterium]|nr:hypothetical protein [Spirochaetales bacterium]
MAKHFASLFKAEILEALSRGVLQKLYHLISLIKQNGQDCAMRNLVTGAQGHSF